MTQSTRYLLGIYILGLQAWIHECCLTTPDDLHAIEFENVSMDLSFHLHNSSNLSNYELKLRFSWEVTGTNGTNYDGFLYKIIHELTPPSDHIGPPPFNPGPPDPSALDICLGLDKTLWAYDANDSAVQCTIPCAGYFPDPCVLSGTCRKLKEDFISLPRDARSIELFAEFARVYEIRIMAYRNWNVGNVAQHSGKGMDAKFCKHGFINEHNIDPAVAHAFCEKEQILSGHNPTSPPSEAELYKVERNLTLNRGVAYFRWKNPHDVLTGVRVSQYSIFHDGGNLDNSNVEASDQANSEYYTIKVEDIVFERENTLKVTPGVVFNETCERGCSGHGAVWAVKYTISDIDACVGDNVTRRYCDVLANCKDYPKTSHQSAECSCPEGYDGNGIDVSWDYGTGCFDYDSCSPIAHENTTCHPNAICIDLPPPNYEPMCECSSDYVGDGYRSGIGCTNKSLVTALGVGLPLIAIVMLLIFFAIRTYMIRRKRKIDRIQSVYLAAQGNGSPATINLMENGNTAFYDTPGGVFGEEWELDRKSIELKGIIGRGNYGVVHKAVLKSDGGEKTVAVKTTSENYSESLRLQFLSEVSLISSLGHHENLMGMIGCCTDGDSPIFLVSEFMKYGDLLHFLWNSREAIYRENDSAYQLTELDIYDLGRQVASGMKYLTDMKVIHGDLAARNILVGEGLKCKISDFGLANDVYRYGVIEGAAEKTVPLKWVSPERLMSGKVPITWRSDVWSFGILLYEAITLGASPYPDVPRDDLFEKIKAGYRMARPLSCSEYLYNIMTKCWQWTPSKRPTFKELRNQLRAPSQEEIYVNLVAVVPSQLDTNLNGDTLHIANGNGNGSTVA